MHIEFRIAYFSFKVCEFQLNDLVQVSQSVQQHLVKLYEKYCTKEMIEKYQQAYKKKDAKFMQNIINEVLCEFNEDSYNVELMTYYSTEFLSIYENVDFEDSPEYEFIRITDKDTYTYVPDMMVRDSWMLLDWLAVKNYRTPSSKSIHNSAFFNQRSFEDGCGKPNYAELVVVVK